MRTVVAGGGSVIAGGGLAGAAAATRLAQGGARPLLIERTAGAHDKVCGDFVSTEAQAHLAALGFDAGRLGGHPIGRVRLTAGARRAEARLPFTALGLTRRRLDAALLDHAAAVGAEVARGVAVRQVEGKRLATSGGDLTADALLLATGKHDVRGAGRDRSGTIDRLIGFKQYFRAAPATLAALAGTIEIVLFDGGYAGVQRVEEGLVNLCLLVDRARFDTAGGDPMGLLIEREPRLARLLGDAARQLARPLAIGGVPYGFVHRADDGLFRLGDQAGVIPSFTGDGMSIALHSARLAADAVLAGATPAAYRVAFRRDCVRQIGRATALQRWATAGVGRRLVVGGIGLWPGLLGWAAAATRVPPAALARAGLGV
ncbi:MAG: electron transfer flavoprotein [Sphingomonadaceae bacterium]|nr:electron transfer flavoprotein [Sphingomonadaceae bacterium]